MFKYSLYCEFCGYKRPPDDLENIKLVEIKTSPIPGGMPYRDLEKNKTETKKLFLQPKKYKCPKCGRGIRTKRISVENSGNDKKNNIDGH